MLPTNGPHFYLHLECRLELFSKVIFKKKKKNRQDLGADEMRIMDDMSQFSILCHEQDFGI